MTKSWMLLLLGFICGGLMGGAIVAHLCTVQAEKHADEISRSLDSLNRTVAGYRARAVTCDGIVEQMKLEALLRVKTEQTEKQFTDGWYTLLYEPEAAAAPAGPSPLELVNLVRPGLGTVLAKLVPPAENTRGDQLRWILPGYVRPLAIPDGWHAVYTRTPFPSAGVQ